MLGKLFTIFIVFTSINGWVLDVSHQNVTPNLTCNVTILCHNIVNDISKEILPIPVLIKISKLMNETWHTIASTSIFDRKVSTVSTYATTTARLYIPSRTYIKIVYNVATTETVGRYRCEVSGFGQKWEVKSIKTEPAVITDNNTPVTSTPVTTTPITTTPVPIYWPKGKYILWKPQAGCPNTSTSNWEFSSLRISTAPNNNKDSSSSSLHLSGKVFKKIGNNNYVTIEMCSQTTAGNGPVWPKGSFCVQAYSTTNWNDHDCPGGFHLGYTRYGRYKDGFTDFFVNLNKYLYYSDYTSIYYCCRDDGKPTDPIILPTFHPFYLLRRGGRCQEVVGMEVSNQWIHFDTGKWSRKDRYGHFDGRWSKYNPDSSLTNGVTTQICYYTPRN